MQLPSSLKPFKHPTLIVVTDHQHALLFLANDRHLDAVGTLTIKHEHMTDRDRIAVKRGSGDMASAEPDLDPLEWSREELYSKLSKELMHRWQNKEFEELAFTVPEEHENELKETLHIEILKRAKVFVPKILVKEDPLDIVAHVQAAQMS